MYNKNFLRLKFCIKKQKFVLRTKFFTLPVNRALSVSLQAIKQKRSKQSLSCYHGNTANERLVEKTSLLKNAVIKCNRMTFKCWLLILRYDPILILQCCRV